MINYYRGLGGISHYYRGLGGSLEKAKIILRTIIEQPLTINNFNMQVLLC